MNAMNDIARFYSLLKVVEANEAIRHRVESELACDFEQLVKICPHSEAIDWNYMTRSGVYRVCKICGIEDLASEGGTPGDEYNYGYPGRPNRSFWAGSEVSVAANESEHWEYRRRHGWRVKNGKVSR